MPVGVALLARAEDHDAAAEIAAQVRERAHLARSPVDRRVGGGGVKALGRPQQIMQAGERDAFRLQDLPQFGPPRRAGMAAGSSASVARHDFDAPVADIAGEAALLRERMFL